MNYPPLLPLRAGLVCAAIGLLAACSQEDTVSGTTHVRIRFDTEYAGETVALAVDGTEVFAGQLQTDATTGTTGEQFDYEMQLGNRRLTLSVDGEPIETEALRHDAKPYLYIDYAPDVEDFALDYTTEARHAE